MNIHKFFSNFLKRNISKGNIFCESKLVDGKERKYIIIISIASDALLNHLCKLYENMKIFGLYNKIFYFKLH